MLCVNLKYKRVEKEREIDVRKRERLIMLRRAVVHCVPQPCSCPL